MTGAADIQPRRQRKRGIASRRRIVQAAYSSIAERGYAATTVAAVAEDAGVSVQGVYFFFGNKLGLFRAAWRSAVFGAEDRPPPEQRWFQEMVAERRPRHAIAIAVDASAAINRRLAPLEAVLEVFSADTGIAGFRAEDERIRLDNFRDLLARLAEKAPLRPGLPLDEAAVILMTVNSPSTYRMSVSRLAWPERRYRDWVTDVVATTIFGLRSEFVGEAEVRD